MPSSHANPYKVLNIAQTASKVDIVKAVAIAMKLNEYPLNVIASVLPPANAAVSALWSSLSRGPLGPRLASATTGCLVTCRINISSSVL